MFKFKFRLRLRPFLCLVRDTTKAGLPVCARRPSFYFILIELRVFQTKMNNNQYLVPKIEQPFNVDLELPGSKSIALRQLAMSALTRAQQCSRVSRCADDAAAMLECLERLGLSISQSNTTVTIAGPMNLVDDVEINSRMSGASTRLLIALAALRSGKTVQSTVMNH